MAKHSEIVADAIEKERAAQELYASTAAKTSDKVARTLLEALADDERRHEELLRAAQKEELEQQSIPEWGDLHVTDHLEAEELTPDASFQEILIYAAKREENARQTYEALAQSSNDEADKRLFERLAADEKGHKYRLERLYDDVVLREN